MFRERDLLRDYMDQLEQQTIIDQHTKADSFLLNFNKVIILGIVDALGMCSFRPYSFGGATEAQHGATFRVGLQTIQQNTDYCVH